jgi:alkylation response protein AidB-like acyl-CoA dehydrogenase
LLPGPLLGSAVASVVLPEHDGPVALSLDGAVVHDAPGATHALVVTDDEVRLVPLEDVDLTPGANPDLTRRTSLGDLTSREGAVVPDLTPARLRSLVVTLAAAEASGVARWCLDTAVEYAGVREQFGKKIGAFQAIKHLCAQMLETSESVTAAAWDAASAVTDESDQQEFATLVAGTICFDGAVAAAKDCIQVLGGIGFTFEHDAQLYLRRAIALRALVGSSSSYAGRLADLAANGVRRHVHLDLDEAEDAKNGWSRAEVRATAERIAALPDEDRRAALAESGFLTPHWPAPHVSGADTGPKQDS